PESCRSCFDLQQGSMRITQLVETGQLGQIVTQQPFFQPCQPGGKRPAFVPGRVKRGDFKVTVTADGGTKLGLLRRSIARLLKGRRPTNGLFRRALSLVER
ncbi:MAG: hypothetical protein ACRD3W_25965, partial [Terriglobales bacterium]